MATTPSVSSLFGDILGPEQVRAQQEAEDLARGEFLAKNRGSAGALYRPANVRNVARSVSGMLGLETRSPAEIKAEENKKLFTGLMQQAQQQFPNSRADQLDFVAQQLLAQGKTQESMKAQDAAAQARMQEAQLGSEQAQAEQRRAAAAASTAQAGKAEAETQTEEQTRQGKVDRLAAQITTEKAQGALYGKQRKKVIEEIATEMQLRDPTINEVNARAAASKALATQRKEETTTEIEMRPLLVEETQAKTNAINKGIEVDDARIKLINEQITTQEVEQEAKRTGMSVDQARLNLLDAELERYEAMTPLEIIKANTEIAKNDAQYNLHVAKLADVGMTDFLRELESAGFDDETKQKLKQKRAEGRAITAGVQGYDPEAVSTKAVLDRVTRYIDDGEEAAKGLATAEKMLSVAANANTGAFSRFEDAYDWVASNVFNVDDSTRDKIASELFDVLNNNNLLEQTEMLKGVLSDSDMKVLRESIAQRGNNPETIALAFTDFAAKRFAKVRSASFFDSMLVEKGSNFRIPPQQIRDAIEVLAQAEYLGVAEQKGMIQSADIMIEGKLDYAGDLDRAFQLLEKYGITYSPYYK